MCATLVEFSHHSSHSLDPSMGERRTMACMEKRRGTDNNNKPRGFLGGHQRGYVELRWQQSTCHTRPFLEVLLSTRRCKVQQNCSVLLAGDTHEGR